MYSPTLTVISQKWFQFKNFETYTRYFWVADEEQKIKVLGVFISNFETCTRYSWVADGEKKKGVFKW